MDKKALEVIELICKDKRVQYPCTEQKDLEQGIARFYITDESVSNPFELIKQFMHDWVDKLDDLESIGFKVLINGTNYVPKVQLDKKPWQKPEITGITPTRKNPVALLEKLMKDNTPFIILSAKDRCALDAMKEYYDRVHFAHHTGLIPIEFFVGIAELREAFEVFQEDVNNTKYPD